ncbi:hypothetical protein F4775DRAFT_606096 [Biscogniauxia sp. FL1348]|nr:hypothetical protein F4775DRAFT_606096 [Biscogniauxia sp. FL1348]
MSSSNVFHQLAGPCIKEKCNNEELSAFVSQTCGQMSWSKEPEAQAEAPAQCPTQHLSEPMLQSMPGKTGY